MFTQREAAFQILLARMAMNILINELVGDNSRGWAMRFRSGSTVERAQLRTAPPCYSAAPRAIEEEATGYLSSQFSVLLFVIVCCGIDRDGPPYLESIGRFLFHR